MIKQRASGNQECRKPGKGWVSLTFSAQAFRPRKLRAPRAISVPQSWTERGTPVGNGGLTRKAVGPDSLGTGSGHDMGPKGGKGESAPYTGGALAARCLVA